MYYDSRFNTVLEKCLVILVLSKIPVLLHVLCFKLVFSTIGSRFISDTAFVEGGKTWYAWICTVIYFISLFGRCDQSDRHRCRGQASGGSCGGQGTESTDQQCRHE